MWVILFYGLIGRCYIRSRKFSKLIIQILIIFQDKCYSLFMGGPDLLLTSYTQRQRIGLLPKIASFNLLKL
jgi:hypothetical protein